MAATPWVTAAGAALLYGGWAGISHCGHGARVALEAGLVQGALSFLSTSTLVLVLEALFRLAGGALRGFVAAASGTISLMIAVMAAAHRAAGTPDPIAAMAPSVVVGSVFFTVVAWRLLVADRHRKNRHGTTPDDG